MTAIWQNDGAGWRLLAATGFPQEAALHQLVGGAPQLLPLAGAPRLVVLGSEVPLGSGYADLLAVEVTGRPVVIEVKLAQNAEARRAVYGAVALLLADRIGPPHWRQVGGNHEPSPSHRRGSPPIVPTTARLSSPRRLRGTCGPSRR
jgi:hypothetical protein